jgi:hypothetical protein
MSRIFLALLSLLIVAPARADLDWVAFTVARHVNATLTAATVNTALNGINDRLRYNNHDCPDDVPCSARFVLQGAVGTFGTATDGLDIITTDTELSAVFAVVTHRVKAVTSIDRCGGETNPSIIGCGQCNAFGYIVEDWVGGDVYVHEYGHNVQVHDCGINNGHRDDCVFNIMNTYSSGANNSLNSDECSGFGGSAYHQLCGNVYDGSGGPLTVGTGPYWAACNVTVPAGRVLSIEPGVEIQFNPGLKITSMGTTNADGSTQRIDLYSNNKVAQFPSAIVDGEMRIENGGELLLN